MFGRRACVVASGCGATMSGMSGSVYGAAPGEQHIVSRESDLLVLRRFLADTAPVTCLVLSGEVGIGKTTLWETGIKLAGAQEYLVLSARASEAEVSLSFASLADLVEGIDAEVLDRLPAPQLNALEVALRRRDPVDAPLDPFAISAGFLSALRALAERGPVLVAVDDVQWLDPSSSEAIQFAARRPDSRIRFMVTRRTGRDSVLERILPPAIVERLEVEPLSFGATNRFLSERFGAVLTHRVVRNVYATSHGNPLFAYFQLFVDDDAVRVVGSLESVCEQQLRRILTSAPALVEPVIDLSHAEFVDHRALLVLNEVGNEGHTVRVRGAKPIVRLVWDLLDVAQPALEFC
jgi:hypothetical protein